MHIQPKPTCICWNIIVCRPAAFYWRDISKIRKRGPLTCTCTCISKISLSVADKLCVQQNYVKISFSLIWTVCTQFSNIYSMKEHTCTCTCTCMYTAISSLIPYTMLQTQTFQVKAQCLILVKNKEEKSPKPSSL